MNEQTVYFVHISDTHIGPTAAYANHGALAIPPVQRLVDRINQMPIKPDFVVHTGDITADPHPDAYRLAAETFAKLQAPIYYVRGNHDSAQDLRTWMAMGPKDDLGADPQRLNYVFEVKGQRFLVLDTFGPADRQPQGLLPTTDLQLLRTEMAQEDGPPLTIFLHHPLLPMDSPWMDANMLLINADEVHQALLPARQRLCGVFFGHIHQSTQFYRDGIFYVSAASSMIQFDSSPSDETVRQVEDEPPGYNFVRVSAQQTMVRQHRFPMP